MEPVPKIRIRGGEEDIVVLKIKSFVNAELGIKVREV